jgi:MFS family permease
MILSLLMFMLGSGLCGGARYVKSMDMLIAARSVQGVGGGGILAMTEISEHRGKTRSNEKLMVTHISNSSRRRYASPV